jgi:uncharacterized membrane protein YfcA
VSATLPPAELVLILLAIGAAGGFLSGLLGVGGGIVFVPALFFCLKAAGIGAAHLMHIAIGTSLAVIFFTGLSSAYHHFKRGSVDPEILRQWVPFIFIGVVAGSFFASSVDGRVLKEIFAVLLFLIAVYMVAAKEKPETGKKHKVPAFVLRFFCFAIGTVSSMIGVGGAILNIPMMTYIGVPMQRAAGTGAALGLAVALPGAAGYMISGWTHLPELPPLSLGYVNLVAVAAIIPASMLVAPLGVRAAHRLPKPLLRRIFAVVLTFVSLRMFMTL